MHDNCVWVWSAFVPAGQRLISQVQSPSRQAAEAWALTGSHAADADVGFRNGRIQYAASFLHHNGFDELTCGIMEQNCEGLCMGGERDSHHCHPLTPTLPTWFLAPVMKNQGRQSSERQCCKISYGTCSGLRKLNPCNSPWAKSLRNGC